MDLWHTSTRWFVAREGRPHEINGHYLRRFIEQQKLQPTDLVWRDGFSEWKQAGAVPEICALVGQLSAPAASNTPRQREAGTTPSAAPSQPGAGAVAQGHAGALARHGADPVIALRTPAPTGLDDRQAGPATQTHDVFVSYAHEDRADVEPLVDIIKKLGWSVFWDQHIEGGDRWGALIEKHVSSAKCVLVVWSPVSVGSEWVINEAGEGNSRRRLVPVSIHGAVPPLAFRHIQAIDLLQWNGEAADGNAPRLLNAIARFAGPQPDLGSWNALEGTDDPAELDGFLRAFPRSVFAGDIKLRLSQRSEGAGASSRPRKRQVQRSSDGQADVELMTWNRLRERRNLIDIERFINGNPQSLYVSQAKQLAEDIWQFVAKKRSPDALEEFARRYGSSPYATKALLLARWYRMQSGGTLADVEDFLELMIEAGQHFDLALLDPFTDITDSGAAEPDAEPPIDYAHLHRLITRAGGALKVYDLDEDELKLFKPLIDGANGRLRAKDLEKIIKAENEKRAQKERSAAEAAANRKAEDASGASGVIPTFEPEEVIGRLREVLVRALFHQSRTDTIDFARGHLDAADRYLKDFKNGLLRWNVQIARDWMFAVEESLKKATKDPEAPLIDFFLKHPQTHRPENEDRLRKALAERKAGRLAKRYRTLGVAWLAACTLGSLFAVWWGAVVFDEAGLISVLLKILSASLAPAAGVACYAGLLWVLPVLSLGRDNNGLFDELTHDVPSTIALVAIVFCTCLTVSTEYELWHATWIRGWIWGFVGLALQVIALAPLLVAGGIMLYQWDEVWKWRRAMRRRRSAAPVV